MRYPAVAVGALVAVSCGTVAGSGSAAGPRPASAPAGSVPAADDNPAFTPEIDEAQIMADVRWLCDPARQGRGYYQAGGRAAADFMAERFAELGYEVTRQSMPEGADNVIARLPGGDDAIVVAAHYDHLGVDEHGTVYPGADDNASGAAVLLAIARALAPYRGGKTVLFVAFGAEEDTLRGSRHYVGNPAWPLARTRVMVNFDMVGRNLFEFLGEGQMGAVAVVGLEQSAMLHEVARAAAELEQLRLVHGTVDLLARFGFDGRTDDWWFREKGIPTIHFSTGLHHDYHKPTDTPEKLKPRQMLLIARVAARIVFTLAALTPNSR
jgi:hypothetical protein